VARKGPIFTEEEVKVKELAFPPSSLQANFTDPASSKKAQMLSLLLSTQEFFDPLLFLWLGPDESSLTPCAFYLHSSCGF
jgi:hypothetical protein